MGGLDLPIGLTPVESMLMTETCGARGGLDDADSLASAWLLVFLQRTNQTATTMSATVTTTAATITPANSPAHSIHSSHYTLNTLSYRKFILFHSK